MRPFGQIVTFQEGAGMSSKMVITSAIVALVVVVGYDAYKKRQSA
jgi:predicted negative regulator of RcsB-dependent stress response